MLEQLLQDFGYLALFFGTFFEGETILVLAGVAASFGKLELDWVLLTAFCGSYAGDQLWYYLGRYKGRQLLERNPRWHNMGERALRLIKRRPDLWVLIFRFFYGLRTVMPVAIGLSGYPPLRYLVLNGIGAIVWALTVGYAAFYFGAALETILGDIKRYELWILAALVLIGAAFWLRRWLKSNKTVD